MKTNEETKRLSDLYDVITGIGADPRRYSGRSMYGKECLGVDCSNPRDLVLEIISEYVERIPSDSEALDNVFELVQLLKGSCTDSMGLGQIVYFPNIAWEDVVAARNTDATTDDDAERDDPVDSDRYGFPEGA